MAFIIKWNLFIGIVAFMAYVVQKIMGKRLGHYWRKVVWILLTIKMCFPLECDGEIPATFFYNFYAGILYGGTKSKDCDHDENWKRFNSRVDVRRKIFAVYMACRDDFMPFVSRNTI